MQLTYSSRRGVNIWPGFVDALAALLIVIIFLLLVFTVGQFYLTDTLSSKEVTLAKLDKQVAHLADLLALEKTTSTGLQRKVGELEAQLSSKSRDIELLRMDVASLTGLRNQLEQEVANLGVKLREGDEALLAERDVSAQALAQVELLSHQVGALRDQLRALSRALGLAPNAGDASMEELAARINIALAERMQELERYRSEFFGRLRAVLGENPDIKVVGDRFILPSELLFDTGSAKLGKRGKKQVVKLSRILNAVAADIPGDLDWVVRIDGHTDRRPIYTWKYPSNWELSTARALAIVKFMIAQGVPAERLAATGFGEFHPLDANRTPEAYAKNRRIEIKLTAR